MLRWPPPAVRGRCHGLGMEDDRTPLSLDAVDVHAEDMVSQPWWHLHAAEAALPACPVCGDRQALLLDGSAACESGPHPGVNMSGATAG